MFNNMSRISTIAGVLAVLFPLCSIASPEDAIHTKGTPATVISRFDNATIGKSFPISAEEYRIGNFRLRTDSGQASLLLAGETPIGLFFRGKAYFEYLSADPLEHATVRTVVKAATSFKAEGIEAGLRIAGPVESFLLWASPELLPQPKKQTSETLAQAFRTHQARFAKAWMTPASHRLVQQLLDHADQSYARFELNTGKASLVYEYDPFENRTETLFALRKIPFSLPQGTLSPIKLSEQKLGRNAKAFCTPNYLLTDLNYTLIASKKGHAQLDLIETILPQRSAQRVYAFELFSAFYGNRAKEVPYLVGHVRDDTGAALPFQHAKDHLVVVLPKAATVNKPFKLHFEISGDVLLRPDGDSFWMLPVGPWFPMPGLAGQYYRVRSTVKVEQPFIAIAPGKTLSRRKEGALNVVENLITKPVQFVYVVGGKYTLAEEKKDGLTIRVASYAMRNKRAEKTQLNLARKIIKFYEPWLGPFPFEEYNIIEINSLGWGQAPPGTMFITREAFEPWFAQIWSQGVNHRFAHEIAHQYWGMVVKMGSDEEQWITESFAEYSASLVIKHLRGKQALENLRERWKINAEHSCKRASIPLSNRLIGTGKQGTLDRRNLMYFKGAVLLAALHEQLGDKLFASFLWNYQKGLAWRFGTTEDMIVLLKKLTGKDYTPFFDACFWGTEMPTKRVFRQINEGGSGGSRARAR